MAHFGNICGGHGVAAALYSFRFGLASEGCRRLYGWTSDEAVGRVPSQFLSAVRPIPRDDMEAAMQRDGEWHGEMSHRRKDGSEVTVAVSRIAHDYADGAGRMIVVNLTDVTALRGVERQLHQTQLRYNALVQTAPDGIIVADPKGQIESVNPAMLRMFGYDHAEALIGCNLTMLMPPIDAAQHDSYIARHREGAAPRAIGAQGRELLAVRGDGTEFPIDLSVGSFVTSGSQHLTGFVRDATARREAEKALRESEARLRLVQAVGRIAYFDGLLSEPSVMISGEFASLYGLPQEKTRITLDEWTACLHPNDRARLIHERRCLRETGGTLSTEFRICRPDGGVRWVTMRAERFPGPDGRPYRVLGAQQDITDIASAREILAAHRHELEQRVVERTLALTQAEARFRGIFDSQFQLISLLAPDGTILEMNRTALDAGGLHYDDAVGQPVWGTGWWSDADREQLRTDIAQAAEGAMIRREVAIKAAGGRSMQIDFSLKPLRDPATGTITSVIAEGRDLTEKHHLAAQLAQAQKVQALGQLAGGIAHDFNNILQAVSGAAQLIEQRPGDQDRTRRLAHTVVTAARRGTSITRRLLSFARRGELRSDAIDTAEMLASVREVLAHTLGTTVTVCVEASPDVPSVVADLAQLETAIINLGTNARDAMPDGGTIILAAAVEHVEADDRHPAGLTAGDYVRLSVGDNGTGMDPATLARASEPFFTTKPLGQGTGLGLAMVRGFVEQSGGALSISSSPGAGTTVVIWLPQATGAPASAAAGETAEVTGAVTSAARILVVDDDDLVRETLADQLESAGFATLVAASGAEALALIEVGEVVDAMVSDLSMPAMNGVTTIKRARVLRPHLPCFLLTGYVGERAALAAEDAFTLVRKPVSGTVLAAQIEAVLEGARP